MYSRRTPRKSAAAPRDAAAAGCQANTDSGHQGYGANDYIPAGEPLVIVKGPRPASGKLATRLCQLYHEYRRGRHPGYEKFETFPIWNLPLTPPVNVAYEAAPADLRDADPIDPFHLAAHEKATVNYDRDVGYSRCAGG